MWTHAYPKISEGGYFLPTDQNWKLIIGHPAHQSFKILDMYHFHHIRKHHTHTHKRITYIFYMLIDCLEGTQPKGVNGISFPTATLTIGKQCT